MAFKRVWTILNCAFAGFVRIFWICNDWFLWRMFRLLDVPKMVCAAQLGVEVPASAFKHFFQLNFLTSNLELIKFYYGTMLKLLNDFWRIVQFLLFWSFKSVKTIFIIYSIFDLNLIFIWFQVKALNTFKLLINNLRLSIYLE